MGYHIDLNKISIDEYKDKLRNSEQIPSRMLLKESIDERFDQFKKLGIHNVQELFEMLKKKSNIDELSKNELFGKEYLTILQRELNSIHAKPNKIKDFIGISASTISKLENTGIKDTLKLFEHVITKNRRSELAQKTGIDINEILELTKLADLSRIKWVGSTFARVLYNAGYDTVEKVSKADYEKLHHDILELNSKTKLYNGHIGLKDMKLLVQMAKDVPIEIEY